jgi:2-polyprenyl-6-methoxyphenol hydroxylase-like FAD-dependent oxidoreductase
VRKLAGFEFPGTEPFMIMRAAQVVLADANAVPPAGAAGHRQPDAQPGRLRGRHLGTTEFSAVPEDRGGPLTAEELAASVRRVAGVDVTINAIREPRRVLDHARQAQRYQLGRVLLAGDAAHVHSPNGGKGSTWA